MKMYTVWTSVLMALLLNICLAEELRFESNDKGQLSALEYRDGESWKSIPFRTDGWGTSWYVRDRDGKSRAITLAPKQNEADSFEGRDSDIVFGLSYALLDGSLAIKASISNRGESDFRPMTAGIRLGFDSYQVEYPTWKKKLIPDVIRCERSHHWGFAMSPDGAILGWACDTPVASYSMNFEDRLHRIY